jgi:hypothetical protein
MKHILVYAFIVVLSSAAYAQNGALKKARETQEAINAMTKPESSAKDGAYLRAMINGKKWEATEMVLDKDDSNIVQVHGKNGNTFLTFNLYKPAPGKEKKFSATSPAIWADETESDFYNGEDGSASVANMNGEWIEGTFSFKGVHEGKTATITNGEFRIPNPKNF